MSCIFLCLLYCEHRYVSQVVCPAALFLSHAGGGHYTMHELSAKTHRHSSIISYVRSGTMRPLVVLSELDLLVVQDTAGNVAWANDNKTLFYVTKDKLDRPFKVSTTTQVPVRPILFGQLHSSTAVRALCRQLLTSHGCSQLCRADYVRDASWLLKAQHKHALQF